MNEIKLKIAVFFKKWEGGLSRDIHDSASIYKCPTPYKGVSGYHTNKGITYASWVSFFGKNADARFYSMSDEDWFAIFEKGYWKPMEVITNDELLLCVLSSWAWGSGVGRAKKHLQRFLGVTADGIIGDKTKTKFNEMLKDLGVKEMASKMCDDREAQFRRMNTFSIHGKGWIRRLDSFRNTFVK